MALRLIGAWKGQEGRSADSKGEDSLLISDLWSGEVVDREKEDIVEPQGGPDSIAELSEQSSVDQMLQGGEVASAEQKQEATELVEEEDKAQYALMWEVPGRWEEEEGKRGSQGEEVLGKEEGEEEQRVPLEVFEEVATIEPEQEEVTGVAEGRDGGLGGDAPGIREEQLWNAAMDFERAEISPGRWKPWLWNLLQRTWGAFFRGFCVVGACAGTVLLIMQIAFLQLALDFRRSQESATFLTHEGDLPCLVQASLMIGIMIIIIMGQVVRYFFVPRSSLCSLCV